MKAKAVALSALLLLIVASMSYANPPDQPYMESARGDLQKAKAELQVAEHDKGGHRVKALGYINSAIAEVNRGIDFARRHNHAQLGWNEIFSSPAGSADQPHMTAALDNLTSAKHDLESATPDKGGHRDKAIKDVNWAIDEVNKGIAAGA
jgi:hypothetical protein